MTNVIIDYVKYTQRQESPEIFHIWTIIATIAGLLGRKVWITRRAGGVTRYINYPGHLMVVLVADSGVKKSTAIMPAARFFKKFNRDIISDKSSVEAFLDQLDPVKSSNAQSNQALVVEGELTSFISKASYLDPLIEVIIKLHDAQDDFRFKTRQGGLIHIKEPSLMLLSATTPESLGERLPASAHGSGFMARIIFVFSKPSDRVEDLSDVEDDDLSAEELGEIKKLETRLNTDLEAINLMAGPFTFSKDGRTWFKDFYDKWRKSPEGKGTGYAARKDDHLLRVAMCWAAAERKMVLEPSHLGAANKLLIRAEREFDKAFMYIGTESYVRDRQRIVDYIAAKGGSVSTSELTGAMYNFFKDSDTLKRTLRLLQEAGVIKSTTTIVKDTQIETWSLAGVEFKL